MFFDLHDGGERTVLVQIAIDGGRHEPDLGEFIELVRSAGGDPTSIIRGSRRVPMAKYFIGQGKLDEIKEEVSGDGVEAAGAQPMPAETGTTPVGVGSPCRLRARGGGRRGRR